MDLELLEYGQKHGCIDYVCRLGVLYMGSCVQKGEVMSFDWKSTLSTIAPLIGGSIGGPMGAVGVSAALKAFGIEPSKDPQDNETLLKETMKSATPADMLLLKQADQQFEKDMAELGLKREQMHQADRGSARQREATVGGNTTPVMAWVIIVGGFSFLAATMFLEMKADPLTQGTVLGLVIGEIRQVTAYYFGSSSGQDFTSGEKQ